MVGQPKVGPAPSGNPNQTVKPSRAKLETFAEGGRSLVSGVARGRGCAIAAIRQRAMLGSVCGAAFTHRRR